MKLLRASATIGGLTLVSRVLGFLREMLMARYLGAGFASDAFLIAWRLPNLFRGLFAEGALSAVFVPMFNRTLAEADRSSEGSGVPVALAFADDVLSVLLWILVIFTVLVIVAAGPVVGMMTGGFHAAGPEKLALATECARITFPYLILISLVALLGGILNSLNRFWVNAAAPILFNLCLIAGLLFFSSTAGAETARNQAIAVVVGGVLQLAWLIFACWRAGARLRIHFPRLTPKVKQLLVLIGPAALGAGASQFNLLISTMLASRVLNQGSVSYLYYADRLIQLPLGLIGVGVGTAMLPGLSRHLGGGDHRAALMTQNRAIELVLLLTLPATVALLVSATPLIRALLQHGAFASFDTVATAQTLAALSLGLPAYVLVKVLVPGFYARSDTRTPVRIALIAVLINLVLNLVLVWPLAYIGLALSTAVSAWANAGLLYLTLRRREHFAADDRLKRMAVRSLAAALVTGSFIFFVLNPLVDPWTGQGAIARTAALLALCVSAAVIYFAVVIGLGTYSIATLKAQIRGKP